MTVYSAREQLAKLGVAPGPVAWSSFGVRQPSVRAVLASGDFPSGFDPTIAGDEWDASWTEEVQGVAYRDERWYFSKDQPQKTLWVLRHGDMKKLRPYDLTAFPGPPGLPGFAYHHIGAVQIVDGLIYIDHFCDPAIEGGGTGQLMVLQGDEHALGLVRWVPLDDVPHVGRVGMIAVVPQLDLICTTGGAKGVGQVFLHDMAGHRRPGGLTLDPPLPADLYAQGGFWSPNNHLYIAAGDRGTAKHHGWLQFIYCYSPVTGRLLRTIEVPTKADRQELEGCCYAPVERAGRAVQVHCVLLENEDVVADDDVYFKSFSAREPELI